MFDITPHPAERVPLVEAALKAGKHVLSQKPFVVDLDTGERLVALADKMGVKLAVNQNGRWAPHFAYMREAVRAGLVGDVVSCHTGVHWDHSWIVGTPFEKIDDLIFFDFAVHWFDFLSSLIGDKATSVYATRQRAAGQRAAPPLLAQALVALRRRTGVAGLRRGDKARAARPDLRRRHQGQPCQHRSQPRRAVGDADD